MSWGHLNSARVQEIRDCIIRSNRRRSILSDAQVVEIRERIAAGERQIPLAREYGVSQGLICGIATGYQRRQAGGPLTRFNPERRRQSNRHAALTLWQQRRYRELVRVNRMLGLVARMGVVLLLCVSAWATAYTRGLGDSVTIGDDFDFKQAVPLFGDSVSVADALAASVQVIASTRFTGNVKATGQASFFAGPGIIPASLFGLHFRFNQNVQTFAGPCPAVVLKAVNLPYGSLRLWDTDTRWQNLNLSSGVFNFACLDPYLAAARTAGLTDLVMTLSSTPTWAASNMTVSDCDYSFFSLGDCSPPSDLNSDGTGTNQHWRDYIYNLSLHISGLSAVTYMAPTYFEMWNEFTRGSGSTDCTESAAEQSWLGTCEQLVRMAQDANCILTGRAITITATSQTCTAAHMNEPAIGLLPGARIMTPDAAATAPDVSLWGTYLSTTGALLNVDRLAVHTYAYQGLGTTMPDSSSTVGNFPSLPAQYTNAVGQQPGAAFGKSIWSTEGSYGSGAANLPDANMQEGYVARYYLVGWSQGFRELYWYAVNNSYGTLIYQNGATEQGGGTCNDGGTQLGCPTLAATGWTATYNWMVGNTMTTPCVAAANLNTWTCGLLKGSTQELAVWDSSQGSAAVTVTITSGGTGVKKVQATLMNGAALSSANNWSIVPIPLGSYIQYPVRSPACPGVTQNFVQVTGYATSSQPNDTLVVSDPVNTVPTGSATAEIASYSFYSFSPFVKYYSLDSGSAALCFAPSSTAVAVGWKPILLSQ